MPKEVKKKLLVKTSEDLAPEAPVDPIDSIESSKEEPKQPKAADRRGKGEHVLANLAKGREALKAHWAEKRRVKEELTEKAVLKKLTQAQKQKAKIMADFGVDSLSSDEEEIEEEAPVIIQKKAAKPKAPIIVEKKPKKKVVRYVEESEEESEEEEVVYVTRSKAPKAAQVVQQRPSILFF